MVSALGLVASRCGGPTHEDQKVLNLVPPCLTSHFLLLYPRFQQQGEWVPVNLRERILGRVAHSHWLGLDSSVSTAVMVRKLLTCNAPPFRSRLDVVLDRSSLVLLASETCLCGD